MPGRVRRRRSLVINELNFHERWDLRTGPHHLDWGGQVRWTSDAQRRAAWETNRDEIMARYVTRLGHRPGSRPAAFWQYDVPGMPVSPQPDPADDAPYVHLRYRVAETSESPEWWEEHLVSVAEQVRFLAEHDLLEPFEIEAIRNPEPRADGELQPWDQAALDGLVKGLRNHATRV